MAVKRNTLPAAILVPSGFCLAMLVTSVHGFWVEDFLAGRTFLYGFILTALVLFAISVAIPKSAIDLNRRGQILLLLGVFLVLPAALAVPFAEIIRTTSFLNAYLEMSSAITTTGLGIYDPDRLTPTLHLWRSLVAWLGGFFMWTAAWAIFAPLRLGGFETLQIAPQSFQAREGRLSVSDRLTGEAARLFPIYFGATIALGLLLSAAGQSPLQAVIFAMGTMATSGIHMGEPSPWTEGNLWAEAMLAVFFIFALSRNIFAKNRSFLKPSSLFQNQELRLAFGIVFMISLFLFTRHFWGAFTVDETADPENAGAALWGVIFTSLSFLTTTGYVAHGWESAESWSGLNATGLVLMGLALIGGGIATTAGGVKLLRISILLSHSSHEIEKLVSPNQVTAQSGNSPQARFHSALMAWVFFMVFAISMAIILLAFAAFGTPFEDALALTIAALSNTGPIAAHSLPEPVSLLDLGNNAKYVLIMAMVLGRLEVLALIALANPDIWR